VGKLPIPNQVFDRIHSKKQVLVGYDIPLENRRSLPLLIMLIGGVVQLGMAYHQLQVLHEALRQGARVAVDNSPATCASLRTDAKRATRQYLLNNGLDPSYTPSTVNSSSAPWTITPTTPTRTEGGTTVRFIEMLGARNPNAQNCIFCPNRFLGRLLPSTRVSFALKGCS
jgi:hypothetical protein